MAEYQSASRPGEFSRRLMRLLPRLLLTLCLLAAWAAGPSDSARAARPNGVGLVVRHGDGRIIYVYVEFAGPSITGAELIQRSGLPLVVSSSGALGVEICSIDSEGCSSENCFCKSYGTPSFYWHYYKLNADGSWANESVGPTSHVLHDGDVDGWSWTSGASGLPTTSIDQIAKLNGVDRSAAPTPTLAPKPTAPPPTPAPTPTPTPTPRVAALPPTAASTKPPAPTATPTAVTHPTFTAAPTTRDQVGTRGPTATSTAVSTPAAPQPTRTATARATATSATIAQAPRASPVVRAVESQGTAGVKPLILSDQTRGSGPSAGSYIALAAVLLVLGAALGWVLYRRRRTEP